MPQRQDDEVATTVMGKGKRLKRSVRVRVDRGVWYNRVQWVSHVTGALGFNLCWKAWFCGKNFM